MTEPDLYAVPPEEFVKERNALAKRLKDEGDSEEAARVKKLPKPSVPAWAVNRAARDDPKAARALVESGEALAKAQAGAAGAGGGEQLRQAMGAHQGAVAGLMKAVEAALSAGGHDNPAMADRARETLRALATDEELRGEFEAGAVARDREPVGFGSAPAPRAAPRAKKDPARERAEAKARKEAERAIAKADAAVERAEARAAKAEKALAAARDELEGARAEAEQAREDAP